MIYIYIHCMIISIYIHILYDIYIHSIHSDANILFSRTLGRFKELNFDPKTTTTRKCLWSLLGATLLVDLIVGMVGFFLWSMGTGSWWISLKMQNVWKPRRKCSWETHFWWISLLMRRAFAELNKHPITMEMGSNARDLCCKPECSQETLSVPRSCHVTTRQFTVGNWAEPPDNWDNSYIERFIISYIKRYIPSKYNPFQLSCSLKIFEDPAPGVLVSPGPGCKWASPTTQRDRWEPLAGGAAMVPWGDDEI